METKRLIPLKLDVTESWEVIRARIESVVDEWTQGRVDVLVNNAGIGYPGLSEEGG